MNRKTAKEMGLKKYYSDSSCKRGHEKWRYTKTGSCVRCRALYAAGASKTVPNVWEIIEEHVHKYDVAAVRDYCRRLREFRGFT